MMDLGLAGTRLQSFQPGYALLLKLSDVYYICIESPLAVEVAGRTISLSPEDVSEDSPSIQQLMGLAVEAAQADDAGGLQVMFEGGARIAVGPNPDYESWNVAGPDGALVVSMPGGGLAVWSPQRNGDDCADSPPAH